VASFQNIYNIVIGKTCS